MGSGVGVVSGNGTEATMDGVGLVGPLTEGEG